MMKSTHWPSKRSSFDGSGGGGGPPTMCLRPERLWRDVTKMTKPRQQTQMPAKIIMPEVAYDCVSHTHASGSQVASDGGEAAVELVVPLQPSWLMTWLYCRRHRGKQLSRWGLG